MPAPVLTAAILLLIAGILFGLALAVLGALQLGDNDGAFGIMAIGLLVIGFIAADVYALAKGDRTGQIVAVVFGCLMLIGGILGLGQGQLISLLWLGFGGAIIMLVVVPVSSRDWFAAS